MDVQIWRVTPFVLTCFFAAGIAGCGGSPEPEKVVVKRDPAPASAGHGESFHSHAESSDSGNLGASHQQEGDQIREQQSAAVSNASPATSAPVDVEAKEGYRVVKAVDGMGRGTLHFRVPEEWESSTPTSSMRIAQFSLPGEDGPAELAIFGPMGGSTRANLDRWIDQVEQADGSSSRDKALEEKLQGDRFESTFLDVSGTYLGMQMQGDQPQENYRVVGSIVETPVGPWFFKATGPHDTLEKWTEGFREMTISVQLESAGQAAGSGSYH